MRAASATVIIALLASTAGVAKADPGLMLDRLSKTSTVGGDVTIGSVAGDLQSGFIALRLDGHGIALSKSRRFGAVLTVPISIVRQDDADEAVFGNFEGGVIARLGTRNGLRATARLALTLPTASGSTAGATANGVSSLLRVNDLALALPETTSLRATGSMLYADRFFFIRADLGVDTPLLESSSRIDDLSHVPLFRVNVAVGVVTASKTEIALESVNALATDNAFDSFGIGESRGVVHQLGMSARTRAGSHVISGGVFLDPSNTISSDDGYSIAAVVGITRPL